VTSRRYLFRAATDAQRTDVAATEIAALLEVPCPKDGNAFHWFRVRAAVLFGNEEGRGYWERHRRQILEEPQFPAGTRPTAFWVYDAPPNAPREFIEAVEPSHEAQARYLHSRNLLTSRERKKVPRDWLAPRAPTLEVIK
jgi:hypothetical protein